MRKVLVTDAGRGSAIEIIRSLGRDGWHVIAADSDARSPGFRSRYVRERLIYPPPEASPRELVDTLFHAARERKIDLILPVTDGVILPLSQARARFAGVCKIALPEAAALDVTTNKIKTLELAKRLGVPAPRTQLVRTTSEALVQAETIGWPVVLKPRASKLYRNQESIESFPVRYAADRHGLMEQMKHFERRCPVLLQEYYQGAGHGVELLTFEGRPLAAFQHKRLRETPPSGGPSAFRESVPLDPVLYDYAVRLLEALKWTGVAMVEFKVGDRGAYLMEINGRVWGSLALAVRSGMDFPKRLAHLYLYGLAGSEIVPETSYAVGVRMRNLELDLVWIVSVLLRRRQYPFLPMPARRQALSALTDLLNPAYRSDIFSLEDPRPGLAEFSRIINKAVRKLREASHARVARKRNTDALPEAMAERLAD